MNILEFNRVYKKFRKGEKFNSLRDFIPNLVKGIFVWNGKQDLQEREFWALKDVSFSLKRGETIGIIGPNGAGKSTILKLISGIMKPNKGEIKIKGSLSALIEITAGFHPELTGRENIYLNGTILGMRKKEIDRKFDEIVDFSGIAEFIDTPVKRYSSGMYSRLGFSVAAHMEPDILLVDEVLAVGDIAFQAKCARKMRDLLNSDTTIILVSHNLALLQSICSRTVLLDKGEIIRDAVTSEVIPYYENIMFKKDEEEISRREKHDFKVSVRKDKIAEISKVQMFDSNKEKGKIFNFGDTIFIKIDFKTNTKVDNPIFCLDIVRSDGVLCCASNTMKEGIPIKHINGQGSIYLKLENLFLGTGTYVAKVSVKDRDMIHAYDVNKNNFFRIISNNNFYGSNAIFLPKIDWQLNKER